MAIQFSLSYNANGDPVLVENTISGTKTVVNQPLIVSEYKPRFTSNQVDQVNQVDANTETNTDNQRSDIYKYINEMENNVDDDQNLSFLQKQKLEAYTPEAVALRKKPKTTSQRIIETVMKAVIPYAGAASAAVKALGAILPKESEEIRAIKQFYADPEMQKLVESIPGMSDYNLVSGSLFNPSYGFANAAQKRIDMINKNLLKGIYKDPESMQERKRKLEKLIKKEEAAKLEQQYKTTASEEIKERTTNIGDVTAAQQRQANRDARAIEKAYATQTGGGSDYSGGERSPGDDTSYSDPFDPGGGE